jgi:uncharacterized protein
VSWLQSTDGGVVLRLRVVPRASRNAIAGVMEDALKIRLQAPPVEGKANKALVKLLAKTLGVPGRDISIIAGETGRNKRVRVAGVTTAEAEKRLGQARTR